MEQKSTTQNRMERIISEMWKKYSSGGLYDLQLIISLWDIYIGIMSDEKSWLLKNGSIARKMIMRNLNQFAGDYIF